MDDFADYKLIKQHNCEGNRGRDHINSYEFFRGGVLVLDLYLELVDESGVVERKTEKEPKGSHHKKSQIYESLNPGDYFFFSRNV